jgi:hypothetical protein
MEGMVYLGENLQPPSYPCESPLNLRGPLVRTALRVSAKPCGLAVGEARIQEAGQTGRSANRHRSPPDHDSDAL